MIKTSDSTLTQQIEKFKDQGYLIFDLDLPHFDELAQSIIADLDHAFQDTSINRLQDAWCHSKVVRELAINTQVLHLLKEIYQREVIPFQTLNFNRGTEQPIHSDTIHFNSIPEGFMCGVWVALEDIDKNNGPLCYYAGSHKLPVKTMQDLGLSPEMNHYYQYEKNTAQIIQNLALKKDYGLIKKGQAILWDANLYHGGSKILDKSRTRHSQVTHYFFEDCLYYTPMISDPAKKKYALRSFQDIRTGEIVSHEEELQNIDTVPLALKESYFFTLYLKFTQALSSLACHIKKFFKR